ncbi:MAG: hypothetical protein MRJ96_08440 [Nitrospirales bacterium]|nr:hypothetical protein [Nitrospira sp.]MDR4501461.1 hypothetical protein [Nitrospirales bacterium]
MIFLYYLDEVKKLAAIHRTMVEALAEEGLRHVMSEHQGSREFRLRKARFTGKGSLSDVEAAFWEPIRDRAYEGRGG